jgi:GTP pyrophosphokinase
LIESKLRATPADFSLLEEEGWLAQVGARFGADEQRIIGRAGAIARSELSERTLATGESALAHALGTARLLADMQLDHESVAAALLLDVEIGTGRARERLREKVGADVLALVEGASRMRQIDSLGAAVPAGVQADQQLEGVRKMLLAMVQDFRVVLLKLAAHTQSLRYLVKAQDEEQRRAAARLSLDIFAPLANRLGVWQLKWELEDLALRITEPDLYKRIARMLDEKRVQRERFIQDARALLSAELERLGIACEITGRPKHIYSIYK